MEPVLSVEELQQITVEAFPDFAVPTVESLEGDTLVLAQSQSARNTRPGGTLSGPTMMALADNAAWLVILAHIGPVLLAVDYVFMNGGVEGFLHLAGGAGEFQHGATLGGRA